MARILVQFDEEAATRTLTEVLTEEGHEILHGRALEYRVDGQVGAAERILSHKPDVVFLPYLSEDAFSVKVMQETAARSPYVKFLFVLTEPVDPGHLVMAVNEGASALLNLPLDPGALVNYTARALARRRREMDQAVEVERCNEVIDREKACSLDQAVEITRFRRLLLETQRLANHLLASRPPRKPVTVLLVSDSGYQLELFRKPLEEHNFQVVTAVDGRDGLQKALADKPRIIISDLEMPGLNGIELCKAVKNEESLAPNWFIICTANAKKIDDILRPETKVDDCLLKPSRPDEFQAFVARAALGLIT